MPIESNYPPIEIPQVDIWSLLFERKDRDFADDKVIFHDPDAHRSYTFAQSRDTAVEFGKGLKAQWDWKRGDVMGMYTPNSIDTPSVMWGCHWAGGIISPANPAYTVDELAFQMKDSGAKALVTLLPLLDVARQAAKKVGIPEDRIILLGDHKDPSGQFKHFSAIKNTSGAIHLRRTKAKPSDLSFLVYSSGTTGHPKGVMLSHTNIVANTLQLRVGEGEWLSNHGGPDGQGDRSLAFLPFYHIYGLTCQIHQALYRGMFLAVMAKFDLERFCQNIQSLQIAFLYVVPPVVLMLGKSPIVDKYDLSSVRMMSSGAAPLTRDLVEVVYKRLKIPVKQAYGMSETSPSTHTQRWDDWEVAMGSVGRMVPNMTAKYMSPEEKEVAPGQTGELWVKGPNVFLGYLNNPEGTASSLTADGYYKTGDVGYQDARGNFFITDRVKELIKYKGFQVPPAELEGVLAAHPKISDVAVIGVYDKDQASEVPRAYVVPAAGVTPHHDTAHEIVQWLQSKVAHHKWLRGGVRFTDEVPKSASGKILRRMLKLRAQEEEKKKEVTRAKL
ncbi:MAG: hypothetical protein M1838_002895 [Thelocarpon superellum]|nr:MAG: hypothetical protein M1838_002895 [Thelocarpon superellum]